MMAAAQPPTLLTGRVLFLARVAWVVMVLFIVTLYIVGIPLRFAELQTPCRASEQICIENGVLPSSMLKDLERNGLSREFWASYLVALNLISAGVWLTVGTIIFARKSDHAMALFTALFLATFGAGIISSAPLETLAAVYPVWRLPVKSVIFLGNALSALFAFLFPNGRFVPRWTRWLALAWIALSVPVYYFPDTPFNYENLPDVINITIFVCFLASFVGAQVIRYRRVSNPTERQQTKWVVFGLCVAIVGFLAPILIVTADPGLERQVLPLMLLNACIYGFMLLIPISFGVAILRSRLWDIDFLIRRTVTYALLTGSLLIVYFGSVIVLQRLFSSITEAGPNQLVTVVSTLAIAALFVPLRHRIQELIDRRFYRKKYDAQQVLNDFANTVRDETDLEKLTERLIQVVDQTMQPRSVQLWLKPSDDQVSLKK